MKAAIRHKGATVNVERLNTIVRALRNELRSTGIADAVGRLNAALQNLASQPGTAQYQTDLSTALSDIRRELGAAASDAFPASWRQTMEELGIEKFFGTALLDEVERIVTANQLTPSIGAEALGPISARLVEITDGLDNLSNGLGFFNFEFEDDLDPGEVELSLLIPRNEVDNDLYHLGREFLRIERIVSPFSEIVTGESPEHLNVRAIASSDFGVYVDLPLKVGVMIATSIAYLMHEYKELLDIRLLRQKLAEAKVPDTALEGLDSHNADLMRVAIETETARVTADLGNAPRDNELRVAVRSSLTDIVVRIDNGYSIDVRVGEPETEGDPDDAEAEIDPDIAAGVTAIRSVSEDLQFIRPGGKPILSLLQGGADDEDEDV